MAELFVFDIAGTILEKLSTPIFQELSLAWLVRDDLRKLENTVSSVRAVLLDAEEQQASNHQLRDWLGKLKDALYDAKNVMDEFEIDDLRREVFQQSLLRKVRTFVSRSNQFAFRVKMGHRIKVVRERFDEIAADRSKFNLTERHEERVAIRRGMSYSYVRTDDVIGRDKDKEDVIRFLMSTSEDENVSVLPIVGLGGLGKTTLAKMVYSDKRVVGEFDLRVWVCVSEDFDLERVVKKILKAAKFVSSDDSELEELQNCLRENLDGHKYLLILDDVWNEDRAKWVDLRNLLMCCSSGSKIIVTTRNKQVASVVATTSYIKEIQSLSHDQCLFLFLKWAFKSRQDVDTHPDLVEIGREIVKKCKGVPLAVRTLGNILYTTTEQRDWIYVRDNNIWKIDQKEGDILPALKLSYHQLPTNLRRCFSFCSIFPKDYEFSSNNLIYFWHAHGLLRQLNQNQDVEDIGMNYIKQLRSWGFFQDFEDYGAFLTFKMHDLVHDLALDVAELDCINMDYERVQGYIAKRKVRYLSFPRDYFRRNEIPRWLLVKQKDVHTIFFPEGMGHDKTAFTGACISKFKYLRFLDLSLCNLEVLPGSIDSLKYLRHIDLSRNNKIESLPTSICDLVGLEILDLYGCSNIAKLPKGLGKLIRLRYLYLTTKEPCLPEEEFRCLTSLRQLYIDNCLNLRYLLSDDAMHQLSALRTLAISHCKSLVSLPIKGLRNLPHLENLCINDCENLFSITDNHLHNDEDAVIAGGGGLPSLQFLGFGALRQLVSLPPCFLHGAINLKHILISDCDNLTRLTSERLLANLKSLQKLWISECSQLTSLPEGIQSRTGLTEIRIEDCPELIRACQSGTGKDWQKVSHVPNIYLDSIKIQSSSSIWSDEND